MKKNKDLFKILIIYIIAILCGCLFINIFKNIDLTFRILYADIIITVIIYLFSYLYNNSSIYDPYWSIIPPFILLSWIIYLPDIEFISSLVIMISVLFWSVRLTLNWVRGWSGFTQEDWRYKDMRNYSPRFFQLSNFFGIHLFPTLIVFICCLPMKYAIEKKYDSISFIFGFFICLIGVIYELISDYQLHQFKKKNNTGIIESGLWKYSRHPNYYGEILFWWGIFYYGLTLDNYYMLVFAPICMSMMFLFISIPWIENKIIKTRPQYKKYQKKTNMLFPEVAMFRDYLS